MNNYVRKVVHLEILRSEVFIPSKNIIAYYKFEKRKGRCKIVLSIDGIKIFDRQTYVFCLVYNINQISYIKEIKTLRVDNNGKVDEIIQIDKKFADNIIGAVIIIKDGENIDYKKQAVLIGYQKDGFNLNNLQIEEKINIINSKESIANIESIEEYRDSIITNTADDIEKITTTDDTQETERIDDINIPNKSNVQDENFNDKQSINTLEYIKNQLEKNEGLEIIDELFEKNKKIEPFDDKDSKMQWIKIEISDLIFLPIESWLLMNNAFLMNNYRKYKHLILGRNKEEGILSLGIPDIYYFKESIIANICGFNEFYSCCGGTVKSGEYGYWIIKTIL